MNLPKNIILGSASPRRRELLAQAGYAFTIITSNCPEIITKEIPSQVVAELSYQKANNVLELTPTPIKENCLIIGADTVVSINNKILGKPTNKEHAFEMLSMLSGKTHEVYTGITLIKSKNNELAFHSFFEKTLVTMYPISEDEINEYINTNEPMDKAGAYGIQGKCARYIKEINGDYYNVVGLPISRLYHEINLFCN